MRNTCTVPGCENPYLAKGFCSPHYHKNRKEQRKQLPCRIDECPNPLHQAGLCHSHYWRKYKHGDVLAGGTRQGESLEWLRAAVRHCIDNNVGVCVEQAYHNSEPGYGEVMYEGRRRRMHVVSVMLSGRDAPHSGQLVRHYCGNGRCVNPLHLIVGTQAENMADAKRHGTLNPVQGVDHPRAKLTETQVMHIRTSEESAISLARQLGVTINTVYAVRRRVTWKHLP